MVKEKLGKHIVFRYALLQDPQFVSKNRPVPVAFFVVGKLGNDTVLNLELELLCCEGVTFGKGKESFSEQIELLDEQECAFFVTLLPEELCEPGKKLADFHVKYLHSETKEELFAEFFDIEATVVRNPVLVGQKEEGLFDGLEEVE